MISGTLVWQCHLSLINECFCRLGLQYRYSKVNMSVRLAISFLSFVAVLWSVTCSSLQHNHCTRGWETALSQERWHRISVLFLRKMINEVTWYDVIIILPVSWTVSSTVNSTVPHSEMQYCQDSDVVHFSLVLTHCDFTFCDNCCHF